MRIKTAVVTLNKEEIDRVRGIIEGGDRQGALEFVRDVLEEKVKMSELPHCVPFFDVGYNPGQAEGFSGELRR